MKCSPALACVFALHAFLGAEGTAAETVAPSAAAQAAPRQAPAPPRVVPIAIPEFTGAKAIFGATGRDRRGHVWFGVCAYPEKDPSARLFELVPGSGKVIDRGDVVSQLKACGLHRPGEGQAKIHSRIVQAADGCLYFASMDEQGEDQGTGKLPVWGSHLWRLRPPEGKWEHLMAAPEGLIAVAGTGRRIYALGYFGCKLYQYDCATGRRRSVDVEAIGGHVSRNILSDRRDHVYVPRVRRGERPRTPVAELVEFDESLRELAATPLEHYFSGSPANTHGIIAFAPLPDGSVAFLTHNGYLSLLRPAAEGPAEVTGLGWFHPRGRSYTGCLFADASGGRLMGVSTRHGGHEWVVYDLKSGTAQAAAFEVSGPQPVSLGGAMLYGSVTRDDAGNFYVAGARPREVKGLQPILLQVRPGPQPAGASTLQP